MNQILEVIRQYAYVGVIGLLLVQMIVLFVVIHMVRKLNRYVRNIHDKVQEYLSVVLEDEEQSGQTVEKRVVSSQEQQMIDAIQEKKKQQEEAVFNAVLQEIFP